MLTITEMLMVAASYLAGAIPFGLLLSRSKGVDIRAQGSGNIGATNVGRLLGRKLGLLTLLADTAKGFLPMYTVSHLAAASPRHSLVVALAGAATVIGHMFPVYLGFRGGKGVATGLGVFLFLAPGAVLVCLAVFALTVAVSGFVSLGSLLGALTVIPVLLLQGEPAWKTAVASLVAVLIWVKHYQNISRLVQGTEKSWKKTS